MNSSSGNGGTRHATVKGLLRALQFFREHPNGQLRVDWCTTWNKEDFRRWFRGCIERKTSADTRKGRKFTDEYQLNQTLDAQIINERARNVFRRGTNLLRTPEMRLAYPNVNTCMSEDDMGGPLVNITRRRWRDRLPISAPLEIAAIAQAEQQPTTISP